MLWFLGTKGNDNMVLDDEDLTIEYASTEDLVSYLKNGSISIENIRLDGDKIVKVSEYIPIFTGNAVVCAKNKSILARGKKNYCSIHLQDKHHIEFTVDRAGIEINNLPVSMGANEVKYVGYDIKNNYFTISLKKGADYNISNGIVYKNGHALGRYDR